MLGHMINFCVKNHPIDNNLEEKPECTSFSGTEGVSFVPVDEKLRTYVRNC